MSPGRSVVRVVVAVALIVGSVVWSPSLRAEAANVPASHPGAIQLSAEVQQQVEMMLQGSATFRAQYARILETPRLVLTARFNPQLTHGAFRARSTFRCYNSGLLVVAMDIGPGTDESEWIAHEFEHVLEQIEGIDVSDAATHWNGGAWHSTGSMIETTRAVRAGRAVRQELRFTDRQGYKVVDATR